MPVRSYLIGKENYSIGESEALAIIWAVNKFNRFLYGQHFVLECDYRPFGVFVDYSFEESQTYALV